MPPLQGRDAPLEQRPAEGWRKKQPQRPPPSVSPHSGTAGQQDSSLARRSAGGLSVSSQQLNRSGIYLANKFNDQFVLVTVALPQINYSKFKYNHCLILAYSGHCAHSFRLKNCQEASWRSGRAAPPLRVTDLAAPPARTALGLSSVLTQASVPQARMVGLENGKMALQSQGLGSQNQSQPGQHSGRPDVRSSNSKYHTHILGWPSPQLFMPVPYGVGVSLFYLKVLL